MLSLRLSSQLLLTFRPFESKLPTLTRLPFESTRCPLPSASPELEVYLRQPADYILSFLNFIREQLLIQKHLLKKRARSSISDP